MSVAVDSFLDDLLAPVAEGGDEDAAAKSGSPPPPSDSDSDSDSSDEDGEEELAAAATWFSSPTVLVEGYMHVRAKSESAWTKRYLVLNSNGVVE